ncbi:MAG: hypothetical protein H6648_03350 [Caldilineae bacterium]|nr:hypothetical protein [Chloroflexota bacterium]MCB9176170.1 hypothetical protein [Caldilineae bacterium]
MARSKILHDLQKADSTMQAVRAKLARIETALLGDKAIRDARDRLAAAEAGHAVLTKAVAQARTERATVAARIEADKQSMYGGKVKGAREVQNLQLEVESLERRLSVLDDAALDQMLQLDEAEAARAEARRRLDEAESKQADQRTALEAEQLRLRSAMRTLTVQRERLRAATPAGDLQRYDGLKASKGGRAVAGLQGNACGACGIELPAEEVHAVRTSGDLVSCRGCGRILHG